MKISKLSVTGLRALSQAEFIFQPGMNLLVGVNGVGKTSVLEALCICLSRILPELTLSRSQKQAFDSNDISIGLNTLQVSCNFEFDNKGFELLLVKQRQTTFDKDSTNIRDLIIESPDKDKITPTLKELNLDFKKSATQPIGIYFPTKRSLLVDQKTSNTSTSGGQSAAFAESLSGNRDFNLRTFALWFKVQEELGAEKPISLKHITVLRNAVEKFLPEFSNLRVIEIDGEPKLQIDKSSTPLDLKQLSDGERGILAMVFDIARRLSQANPELSNPLMDGKAIVLIDELDLHLHPRWQRTVVENLTRTFPNCQFIVTTHSPQIIPSVEPEQVILIKGKEIIHPDRTKGMDSNWILKFLMESEDRPKESTKAIEKVESLINENKFKEARTCIADYKKNNLDLTEWSIFEARIARLEVFSKPK